MNLKIKFRESFRPFAPCVLREDLENCFQLDAESPYMLLVAPVRPSRRLQLTDEQKQTLATDPDLCRRVNIPRSDLPAITHVDYSARVQTVDGARHGRFYRLMQRFKQKTGCPVIINTSFNIRGEPIVCTPGDAWRCFLNTDMDVLVLEDCLLLKERQGTKPSAEEREVYKQSFSLD